MLRSAANLTPHTAARRPRPWLVRERGFLVRGSSVDVALRPWPSVETDGYTDRPGGRTPSAMRPWTPQHDGLQRDKVTHHGTEKKRPASTRIRS
jgi:hypothetical protein